MRVCVCVCVLSLRWRAVDILGLHGVSDFKASMLGKNSGFRALRGEECSGVGLGGGGLYHTPLAFLVVSKEKKRNV